MDDRRKDRLAGDRDRLIVALDGSFESIRPLVRALRDTVRLFKVGLELFCDSGFAPVEYINQVGGKVFLDLKFHDIPNTIGRAVKASCKPGVFMINVHALGGVEMMRSAIRAAEDAMGKIRPYVVAVTILTSIDQASMARDIGLGGDIGDNVVRLSCLAREAGLDGVVSSPLEIGRVRKACGDDFLIVTPGIRPATSTQRGRDDQRRVATPREAISWGADFIVVGRPITAAPDPPAAAASILFNMGTTLGRTPASRE